MRVPQVSERIKEAPAQALRGVFAGIGQLLLVTDKLRNKAPAGRHVARAREPGAAGTVTDTTVTSPAAKTASAADAETTRAANGVTATADSMAPEAGAADPATVEASAAGAPVAAEAGAQEAASAKPAVTRRAPAKPTTAKPAARPATTRHASAAKPAAAEPSATGRSAAKPAIAEPAHEAPEPPKRQSTRDFDKTGNVRLLDGSALDAAPPATAPEPVTTGAPEPVSAPADVAPPLPNYDELSLPSLRARLRNLDVAQVRQLADYERAHAARAEVLTMFERRVAKLEAQA
jgi:hypothetical protein